MSFQDNPFQKNIEFWQQFGENYTQNMMSMFEKNMEQSRAFQEQMQEAVSQVVNSQFDMIMNSLKAVQEQVDDLARTVNEMSYPEKSKESE